MLGWAGQGMAWIDLRLGLTLSILCIRYYVGDQNLIQSSLILILAIIHDNLNVKKTNKPIKIQKKNIFLLLFIRVWSDFLSNSQTSEVQDKLFPSFQTEKLPAH